MLTPSLGAGTAKPLDISTMDLETAMFSVQTQRANLLEAQLRDQLQAVQNRNRQIETLNSMLSAVRAARPGSTDGKVWLHNSPASIEMPKDMVDTNSLAQGLEVDLGWAQGTGGTNWANGDGTRLASNARLVGQASDGLADLRNPQASTVTTPLQRALTEVGLSGYTGRELSQGEVDQLISTITSKIDGLNSSQQLDMLRLQSLSNKRNEAFEVVSNFVKKMQDNNSAIVSNMR